MPKAITTYHHTKLQDQVFNISSTYHFPNFYFSHTCKYGHFLSLHLLGKYGFETTFVTEKVWNPILEKDDLITSIQKWKPQNQDSGTVWHRQPLSHGNNV